MKTEEEIKAQAEKTCIMIDKNERACYAAGYLGGYWACESEYQGYERKVVLGDMDKQNKIVLLSQKVYDLQKELDYQKQARTIAENAVVDLTKENKDLNKKLFQAETDCDKLHWERNDILADRNKAKELLNEFMRISKASDEDFEHDYSELIGEAEQFLKEEFTTELSNECHDCAKFDEMPKGPRCKTCDNGSHFQKKEIKEK